MTQGQTNQSQRRSCYCCGATPSHPKRDCPAKDSDCFKCGRKGHFTKCCKSKVRSCRQSGNKTRSKVHELVAQNDTYTPEQYAYTAASQSQQYQVDYLPEASFHSIDAVQVHSLNNTDTERHIRPLWLTTETDPTIHKLDCEVDSGAGCNVMPLFIYKALFGEQKLSPATVIISGYGNQPVQNLGSCIVQLHTGDKPQQTAICQVTNTSGYLILGRESAAKIGYIEFPEIKPPTGSKPVTVHSDLKTIKSGQSSNQDQPHMDVSTPSKCSVVTVDDKTVILNGKKHDLPITKEYILREYKDVFCGIGTLPTKSPKPDR